MNTKFFLVLSFFFSLTVSGQNNFWQALSSKSIDETVIPKKRIPAHFQTYEIDLAAMSHFLNDAPAFKQKHSDISFEIPDEKGNYNNFKIFRSGTLSPELQNNTPINTYRGYAANGAIASIVTSPFGLHIGVLRPGKPVLIIETSGKDLQEVIVFSKDQLPPVNFECFTDTPKSTKNILLKRYRVNDNVLRTYRFAVATTGEYSQYHINRAINMGIIPANATDAQKKDVVLAAVTVTVDRLNSVYERDFGVSLELVPTERNVIFLDPNTDPYDNSNLNSMLNGNTNVLNNHIGSNNYDGGHLFSTNQDGGVSGLGIICGPNKGRSVTGSTNPIGDGYDIDFVAHEVGHAFGCNHTFGNSCNNNRNLNTAVEPGSGSSIMAYAGVCSPNVQIHSDDYFHVVSIDEAGNFISTFATCSANTNIGNHTPVITVVNYGAVHIPKNTPFMLTANAQDADAGDALTYCWEQIDHVTDNNAVNWIPSASQTNGPEFRTYNPNTNNTRYFPIVANIFNNDYKNYWEVLSNVNRTLSFAVTVRDNHPGGGQTPFAQLQFSVDQTTGPFRITNMANNETWQAGQTKTIQWNVAGTTGGSVNCNTVDILFSADNGVTFPYTVASNVPNNGSAQFTVPDNENTSLGRFMVKGHNNYFFDLAHGRFTIQGAQAVTQNNLDNLNIYPNPVKYKIHVSFEVNNINQSVKISLYDLSGREVMAQNFDSTTHFNQTIYVGNIAKGIYFIKVKNGQNEATKKLIIK